MKTTKHDEKHWVKELNKIDMIYQSSSFQMPVHYIFSLTNECNLNCSFCFLEHNVENELDFTDWINIVSQLPSYSRIIFFGGEPLIHKDFNRLFKAVAAKFHCTIVTNGTLLDESKIELLLSYEGLKNIFISIDSLGNWNRGFTKSQWIKLVGRIKLFNRKRVALKNPPKLGINTVILDNAADELFDLHTFCHEELVCDYMNYCLLNGAKMQLSDNMREFKDLFIDEAPPGYEKWETIFKNIEKIRKYNKDKGYLSYFRPKIIDINANDPMDDLHNISEVSNDSLYGPCKIPWADCRIHPNGNVSPCLAVSYGNVKQLNLERILQGEVAKKIKNHIVNGDFFPQCKRCVMRYHNKFFVNKGKLVEKELA